MPVEIATVKILGPPFDNRLGRNRETFRFQAAVIRGYPGHGSGRLAYAHLMVADPG